MSRISQTTLEIGAMFEDDMEDFWRKRGYSVIRNCDQKGKHGTKAPMAWGPFDAIRLPDFLLMRDGRTSWAEAKYKGHASTNYRRNETNHGIDIPNWEDYLKVRAHSGQELFMYFGEGDTGKILCASAGVLTLHSRFHRKPTDSFPDGGVFWRREVFQEHGEFNPTLIKRRFIRVNGIYIERHAA